MTTFDECMQQIKSANTLHQASWAAVAIYQYKAECDSTGAGGTNAGLLTRELSERTRQLGFPDLLVGQCRYAIRLAESSGDLLYEEMHKLYSLLIETTALRDLGFQVDDELFEALIPAVRSRIAAQSGMARMVAQDRVEDWSRNHWWFVEALS